MFQDTTLNASRHRWWGALYALLMAPAALASELNALSHVQVSPMAAGAEVVVSGSRPPTFTVFQLNDPDRLVVDVAAADASKVQGHHEGAGPVSGVVASQFSDERSRVARVLVALNKAVSHDVRADGNKVRIVVRESANAAQTAAHAVVLPKSEVSTPAVSSAEAPARAKAENVIAAESDERQVRKPARRITGLRVDAQGVSVDADGELSRYELIELTDPPRLALDVYGVKLAARLPKAKAKFVKEVRGGEHADKVRLVLDMREEMPSYQVKWTRSGGLAVKLAAQQAVAAKPATALGQGAEPTIEIDGQRVALDGVKTESEPIAVAPTAPPTEGLSEVKDLSFEENPRGGEVALKLSGKAGFAVERPDSRSAVLTLKGARLPKRLERSLDTSALETPVKMVSAFAVPGTDNVRVVIAADGEISDEVKESASGLSWKLRVKTAAAGVEAATVVQKTAGFSTEAPTYAMEGAPQQSRRYSGRRVSFEFKDIDIQNLLRVIAEVSKRNVIVADDVSGKVTIRLRNVPWDQALDLILRSKSLGKEVLGNIIRVAPLKTLEEEAKLREERKKALMRQEDLVVNLIPVNYSLPNLLADKVKEVLSERGSVSHDPRTGVLIVRDVPSKIHNARNLVKALDIPTPQVMIESRIVEANTNFTRQLGVQWGGQGALSPATGNPTGLSFPNTFGVFGGVAGTAPGVSATPNFAVNLPAAVGPGSGGALGFLFGSAGGAVGLNLRLSALEAQGSVKTISAPKVTTLDKSTAKISQGVSIPFSQVSAGGVNTTFIEARLQLEVTPYINQDGGVLLKIKAENNQPDPSTTGANGQPAIQRKEAETLVSVKDGDTTVIGGIYVRRSANQTDMVPFLGRIPILGFFFKNTFEQEQRQELLIFITPRILNRTTFAQSL
ncbi:MAG: type IV pilus secretin PilQ [Myxococcaceae bacterium]